MISNSKVQQWQIKDKVALNFYHFLLEGRKENLSPLCVDKYCILVPRESLFGNMTRFNGCRVMVSLYADVYQHWTV